MRKTIAEVEERTPRDIAERGAMATEMIVGTRTEAHPDTQTDAAKRTDQGTMTNVTREVITATTDHEIEAARGRTIADDVPAA